jgi:N-methylhydantoinase A
LTVPLTASIGDQTFASLRTDFDDMHRRMFGHVAPDETVEIVSFRLRGVGRLPPVAFPKFKNEGRSLAEARRGVRRARFGGVMLDCPVYQRERLDVGHVFSGPAIVDQLDTTTVIVPGQTARIDEFRNLLVSIGKA